MLRQDFVVFTAAAIVQFLSLSVRSYRNLYLQVLPRYLSRYFASCFYKGQLFRLNTWIRHATQWGGTGGDAGRGRRLPRSRPANMVAHLLRSMLGNILLLLRSLPRSSGDGLAPAAGGGTGTLCPEYGKRVGRASLFPVSSSWWERAKSACCRYFSWTGRLNYSFCSLNCNFQIPFFPPNITSALQEMSPGKCSSLRSWFLCKDPVLMGDKHGGSSPPQTFWLGRNETLLLVVFQPIY